MSLAGKKVVFTGTLNTPRADYKAKVMPRHRHPSHIMLCRSASPSRSRSLPFARGSFSDGCCRRGVTQAVKAGAKVTGALSKATDILVAGYDAVAYRRPWRNVLRARRSNDIV